MDGILLEGQERSGVLTLRFVLVHNKTQSPKLFARRGNLPNRTKDSWTTFEMDLREPTPVPAAFDFTRFLVSSITFMAHLREVSVFFDDKQLVHLTKDTGVSKPLTVPRNLRPTSGVGFMNIKGLKSTCVQFIRRQDCFLLTTVSLQPCKLVRMS